MNDPNPKERLREDTGKPNQRPDQKVGTRREGVTEERDHEERLRPDLRHEDDERRDP